MTEQFWVVFVTDCPGITEQFDSREAAEKFAASFVRARSGSVAYILKPISSVTASLAPVVFQSLETP